MKPHLITPAGKTRARALRLPFPGEPSENNAITDVAGVEVGVTTLVSGEGKLIVGQGPVRTGVTALLPRGRGKAQVPCAAGSYALNGNGEMTGTIWMEESGELQTPITITNTHSCGVARDATIEWLVRHGGGNAQDWGLPVAAETYDGDLNDVNGFHVKSKHVMDALENARGGPIELGSVGGGTGMICYDFKGGNGTASRIVKVAGRNYTVGALVQSNFGQRPECTILGVSVGLHLKGDELRAKPAGSIIVAVATDAPLEAHQLKRIARRIPLGLARTGGIGHNSSGDIFLAFSTANEEAFTTKRGELRRIEAVSNSDIDPLFIATIEATEEAIIDSMIANETMVGRDGRRSVALPHDRLIDVMKKYGRM
jgi:L-aminopeptidase/D-esterase-like protein